MKKKLLPPLLLLLMLTPAAALTADQKITAVTVYPDRALVTRSGTVSLEPGVQAVVFGNLPLGLEEDSVRAKATGKLKILGVEVRRDYKEAAVNVATKQLQDDQQKLEDQIRALTDERGDLQRRTEFLDRMRDKVTSPSNAPENKDPSTTVSTIQGLFDLYGTETARITTRKREIEFLLRDLNKQHDEKENQLSLLQQPAAPNTRSAIVTVEVAEGGAADLQVSYLIPGAGWQPQYDAYADPATKKVELTNYGVVRQNTGENWNDVALTLSSARPSMTARLPELTAWAVDFGGMAQPAGEISSADYERLKKAGREEWLRQQATANTAAALPVAAPPVPAATTLAADAGESSHLQTAQVLSLGPSATFIVPAKTSIPSDNQPHRSAISIQSLKGEWTYVTTPKLVASAFLKTKVINTSGGPLLGGEINAFLGNNYVGKSSIGLVAANASFDLYLGVDENIKVTRIEGVQKEEAGGIISRLKIYKRSFTIEVQNFKDTEASFKLLDQLPVSKNGQIEIVVNKAEPAFKSRDENSGELNWEFKLKPNEKQKFTIEYEIEAPYNQSVAGV